MRKYWLVIVFMALQITNVYSQDGGLLESLFGNNESLIDQALKQTAVVIRQDYVVKDSAGVPYGQGNLPYFGRAYGIGIVSNGQLWVSSHVRQPWVWDAKYTPYKDTHTGDTYEMTWRKLGVKDFGDTKKWKASIEGDLAVGIFEEEKGVMLGDSLPKNGRLAVFYIEKGEKADSAQIQIASAQLKNIKWDKDGTATEDQINLKGKQILGGALFTEHVSAGSITFKLSGIYVKTTNLSKPWRLHKLVIKEDDSSQIQQLTPQTISIDDKEEEKAKKKKRGKKRKN